MGCVLLVTADGIGRGDDDLGRRLMPTFLTKAPAGLGELAAVALMHGGVRLAAEGAPALQALGALEERGVEVVACGTCVDALGVRERLRVGRVGSMDEILALLGRATKVVTL